MNRFPTTIIALLLGLAAHPAIAGTIHLAPDGNDSHAGTAEAPLASIGKALSTGAKDIVLHAGTYRLNGPVVLSGKDSGTTIHAAPREKVILSGACLLSLNWKAGAQGKFTATVPPEITGIDSLWINGKPQVMARYPNYDPAARFLNGVASDVLAPERVLKWQHPVGAWLHAMHPSHWGGVHDRITGVSADGKVTTEGGWGNNRGLQMSTKERFVENIEEELDAPGEWFFHATTHVLTMMPEAGVDLSKAEVASSCTGSIFELQGSKEAPVTNVKISGLTLTQTARTFMKTREALQRSDWMIYRGGAVYMNRTVQCEVSDCDFIDFGGNGIFFSGANQGNQVKNCHFKDGGASGVCFVGDQAAVRHGFKDFNAKQPSLDQLDLTPGPQTDDYPMECSVRDCLMENLGRVEKQTAGVTIHMSQRITVSHCSIHHVPRSGINIGDGCWGGHVIDGCDVYDTVLESGDHGSFNSWARDRWWGLNLDGRPWEDKLALLDCIEPVTLRNSRWECQHGWDIDLDDGSSNYLIENNLLLNGGLKFREGYHRTARNNLIPTNGFHMHVWPADSDDNVVTQNITSGGYTGNVQQPANWGLHCDANFLHRAGQALGPATPMQTVSGYDTRSLMGDAQFKDPVNQDWSLLPGSPAITKLGFKPFPLDQFGVQHPRLKAAAMSAYADYHTVAVAAGPRDGTILAFMGGKVKNLEASEKDRLGLTAVTGVLVVEAPPGSALQVAHLVKDDVILSWDEAPVPDASALQRLAKANPSPIIINAWHEFAKLGLYR